MPARTPGRLRLLGGLRERISAQRSLAPRYAPARARPLRGLPERRRRRAGAAGLLQATPGPWFAVVSLEAPHPPYDAPAAGIAAREPASNCAARQRPGGRRGRGEGAPRISPATTRTSRRRTGRSAASSPRLPPETRVVFTSVHGDMHGSHGLFRKGWPHEESVRVPLLVRGRPAPAGRDHAPVSLLDLPRLIAAPGGRRGCAPAAQASGDRAASLISMPSVVGLPDQCDRTWTGRADGRAQAGAQRRTARPGFSSTWSAIRSRTRNLAGDPAARRDRRARRRVAGAPGQLVTERLRPCSSTNWRRIAATISCIFTGFEM